MPEVNFNSKLLFLPKFDKNLNNYPHYHTYTPAVISQKLQLLPQNYIPQIRSKFIYQQNCLIHVSNTCNRLQDIYKIPNQSTPIIANRILCNRTSIHLFRLLFLIDALKYIIHCSLNIVKQNIAKQRFQGYCCPKLEP